MIKRIDPTHSRVKTASRRASKQGDSRNRNESTFFNSPRRATTRGGPRSSVSDDEDEDEKEEETEYELGEVDDEDLFNLKEHSKKSWTNEWMDRLISFAQVANDRAKGLSITAMKDGKLLKRSSKEYAQDNRYLRPERELRPFIPATNTSENGKNSVSRGNSMSPNPTPGIPEGHRGSDDLPSRAVSRRNTAHSHHWSRKVSKSDFAHQDTDARSSFTRTWVQT